ncbi:hypothetical protein M8J76_008225 [Diaphorina citri]|nr:hypothetical protein M8J75_015525 [Diaphorina citri]KAI5726773.1 hypothetical protein M8J76_008225 [Diaphorina citri]
MCLSKSEKTVHERNEKSLIRNRRAAKTTTTQKYYFYQPILPVNRPDIAKSSEEVNIFEDSRVRICLLQFLQNNHSSLWNRSIEDAIYEPMKFVYQYGGIPKLNSLEGYFVAQRFVDNYEKELDIWINEHIVQMIKEDKNYRRQNLLEMLRRHKNHEGKVPYHYVEQYWAWELYHTERYNKRELVLRNSLHVIYGQLEKYLHNFVFSLEKWEHPGIPIIPFNVMMDYLQAGQPFMQDTLKKLFLGSIDVLQ